jgi:hypothetical protein
LPCNRTATAFPIAKQRDIHKTVAVPVSEQRSKLMVWQAVRHALIIWMWPALLVGGASPPFQPSPPYHATFFYPWYPQWSDRGHQPPDNWFSNYLPDPNPCAFDPAGELYSSTDDRIFFWQLRKMAEARIEVAIASWWGRTHKTDRALRYILADAMNRPDNPYPHLRWAIYYEKESIGDPSPDELVSDLEYIRETFASQPSYLIVNGKPVIFVYASGTDQSGMAARWAEARRRTNFYVVLKVYPNYRNDPNQPDSWHQYAPANRSDRQTPYSWMVSPGFWLDGESVRLERDLSAFRAAVAEMVRADVTWKLIQTWNEWGEGTSVEPGEQVIQTLSGKAAPDPNGKPFRNLYIDALRELLPPLEQGTGAEDRDPRVLNLASGQPGPLSPGLLVAIQAENVRFDCEAAPALKPGVFRVPRTVAGRAYVRVDMDGDWTLIPLLPLTPAVFTPAVHPDGTLNSAENPAPAGGIVSLFATGAGIEPYPAVTVEIGGRAAEILFAGEVEGLFQVNLRIPPAAAAGPAPVTLKIGDAASPEGPVIFIR